MKKKSKMSRKIKQKMMMLQTYPNHGFLLDKILKSKQNSKFFFYI